MLDQHGGEPMFPSGSDTSLTRQQFGFSGNTGESMGWILVFLLQSPALLQQVKLEIASLPAGSIAAVDMRQACRE